MGVPSLFWGVQVAALRHPFSLGKFVGAQSCALPYAYSRSKGARPPTHPQRGPGPPASALPGCTPFSPARLTPARAWRRHGHFALANRRGGRKQRGKGRKGGRVAPDVTGVADERRPPLHWPPRPCLSLRFGARSRGSLQVERAEVPRAPASASLAVLRSPRGAPGDGMRPGRLRREPGAAGDCSDPGAGGAGDAGAGARGRRGKGWGWGSGWERAVHGSAHRSAPGLPPTENSAHRMVVKPRGHSPVSPQPPWSLELEGSSPIQPSLRPAWKNFIPAPPDAPRTVAVRNAEAK